MHLIIDAYGETRFNVTYDPCEEDMGSLCPLESNGAFEASGVLSLSADELTDLPSIALGIPDVEGFARLHIFANSSESQVGCFQAVLTNGSTFSQRQSVGVVLAVFTFLAMVASFVTAIYGVSIVHMRTHYAHSFSALVVWETFQSIFLSGALSVRWPSILPAWWSNYAFAAGMVANNKIVQAVGGFTGNAGNTSQVGGAGPIMTNGGGGLLSQIYGAYADGHDSTALLRRDDYSWHGDPQRAGLPLPGTWPGLGGTLSSVGIPPADAFIIALIWFMVALVSVAFLITLVKLVLDTLVRVKALKSDGFDYFRAHWLGYVGAGVMRTLFIGFFVMVTLALYQLSLRGRAGPTALAAIVLIIFAIGLGSIAGYACFFRLRQGRYAVGPDTLRCEQGKLFKTIPFMAVTRESKIGEQEASGAPRRFGSIPFVRIQYIDNDPDRVTVHLDDGYVKRFGWLSGRYRRSRWWFFAAYLFYQFVRGCFLGGASQDPMVQVYGLLVFEILTFLVFVKFSPFEGQRNTVVAVWMLSFSKIVTNGLAIAFLPDYNLSRIAATVIGLIILIVQGFLTLAVMTLVIIGIVSSWMSLSRNTERFPEHLEDTRVSYFEHIEHRANDIPGPRPSRQSEEEGNADAAMQRTFSVREVRRAPKIEDESKDEDLDAFPDLEPVAEVDEASGGEGDGGNVGSIRRSRANSANSRYSSTTLPRAARVHRASWSSRDFSQWDADPARHETRRAGHRRSGSLRMQSLIAQGAGNTDDTEASRRTMPPTEERIEEGRLSIDTSVAPRSYARIEEVDDEEKRVDTDGAGEPYTVSPPTPTDNAAETYSEKAGAPGLGEPPATTPVSDQPQVESLDDSKSAEK